MAKKEVVYTAADYLLNKVRFSVPRKAVRALLADRGIDLMCPYVDCERDLLRLAYADILKWILIGPSKMNNTSDADNGWSHTEGGYELSASDRAELRSEANAIYEELEPASVLKRRGTFKIMSFGVKRANKTLSGDTIPPVDR